MGGLPDKPYLDAGARKLLEDAMRELGDDASASEAIRHLSARARKYDEVLREAHRSRRVLSG